MKNLKTILICFLAIATTQSFAFDRKIKGNGNVVTINRTTEEYDTVAAGGSFDVELVKGSEGNLTIQVEENLAEYLVTEVKKGALKIKWKKGYSIRHKKSVKVIVPIESINGVSLAGSGQITSTTTIKTNDFGIALAGSGDIVLEVNATSLKASIAGSGDLELTGSSTSTVCSIAGSGSFDGYEYEAGDLEAKISGSGNIKATVNGDLNASIAGSGNVKYKGNPTTQKVKVSGSGNISKI
ncbi:head GIN domain-containing protein [Urechidicola sp. KH5]